jgi:hypothetical protein
MIITLKHYGVTHSTKTPNDDLNTNEVLEIFKNIMMGAGFTEQSVENAILDAAEEIQFNIQFNIDRKQMSYNKN